MKSRLLRLFSLVILAWLSGTVGWTTDLSASSGTGWRAHLHLNGNYIHLRALNNEGAGAGFAAG